MNTKLIHVIADGVCVCIFLAAAAAVGMRVETHNDLVVAMLLYVVAVIGSSLSFIVFFRGLIDGPRLAAVFLAELSLGPVVLLQVGARTLAGAS